MHILNKSRLAAFFFAIAALPVQAGILDDDEARKAILDLRAKVDAITKELNAKIDTKADKNVSLDIVNQREQLMSELARLRGQVEELANAITQQQKRSKDLYADLDARLKKLEPKEMTIDGKKAAVDPAEQKAYEAALTLLKSGDYAAASQSLGDFVRRYPDSGYASLAQHMLGNALYANKDYKASIAAQQAVIANYPDSSKAPDAMLNIAASYTELKDKKNTRKVLQDLVKQYPESSAAETARDRLKSMK